jgi:G3E family GTPase
LNEFLIICISLIRGSGKTTLVQHILKNTLGIKILVIENEIGAEGIDHELLLQAKNEEIILMNNGCICCTGK